MKVPVTACFVDDIFHPKGRIVGSAPGYFSCTVSQVMVVVRIRVSVSVNKVTVRVKFRITVRHNTAPTEKPNLGLG